MQLQGSAGLLQPQTEARAQILASTAQGVTVAIEVTAADASKVEAVEAGLNETISAWFPTAWAGFDLFQYQELPVAAANGLGQHREAVLLQWTAVKQSACGQATRNEQRTQPCRDQTDRDQTGGAGDRTPHARLRKNPCCTELWW